MKKNGVCSKRRMTGKGKKGSRGKRMGKRKMNGRYLEGGLETEYMR